MSATQPAALRRSGFSQPFLTSLFLLNIWPLPDKLVIQKENLKEASEVCFSGYDFLCLREVWAGSGMICQTQGSDY